MSQQNYKYDNNTILSLKTHKVWQNKNIGAKRVCKNVSDNSCFGHYFPYNTKNAVCPTGFRLPTKQELIDEQISSTKQSLINLKLPLSGYKDKNGKLIANGYLGILQSSSGKDGTKYMLGYTIKNSNIKLQNQQFSFPVRCIKQ